VRHRGVDEGQPQGREDQQGAELNPEASANLTFTGFLTQEGIAIQERKQIEGTLTITAGNYGQTWVFKVPVKTTIGFGAELDNEDCLQVTPKNWVDSTEGKAISFEFQIQNNCSSNGQPIAISDLEAKVEWQGNEIGTFLLGIYESKTSGAVAAAELRSGYFKRLIDRFEAEKTYSAILSFTPSGGVNGLANPKIIIRAKNKTEGQKDQIMTGVLNIGSAELNLLPAYKTIYNMKTFKDEFRLLSIP